MINVRLQRFIPLLIVFSVVTAMFVNWLFDWIFN
jgi:hypothetical protein